ncbi:MAG TPA: hypothetical protein VGA49_00520 [Patescibacteria group bacterium]
MPSEKKQKKEKELLQKKLDLLRKIYDDYNRFLASFNKAKKKIIQETVAKKEKDRLNKIKEIKEKIK